MPKVEQAGRGYRQIQKEIKKTSRRQGKVVSAMVLWGHSYLLHGRTGEEVVVDAGAEAEEGDACGADGEGNTGVAIGLERRQGRVARLDVHGLDDEQIVVQTHDGVDQGYEDYEVGPEGALLGSSHKHKELGEHTCERRNTSQREQGQRHEERQLGVGLVETVVGAHLRERLTIDH